MSKVFDAYNLNKVSKRVVPDQYAIERWLPLSHDLYFIALQDVAEDASVNDSVETRSSRALVTGEGKYSYSYSPYLQI